MALSEFKAVAIPGNADPNSKNKISKDNAQFLRNLNYHLNNEGKYDANDQLSPKTWLFQNFLGGAVYNNSKGKEYIAGTGQGVARKHWFNLTIWDMWWSNSLIYKKMGVINPEAPEEEQVTGTKVTTTSLGGLTYMKSETEIINGTLVQRDQKNVPKGIEQGDGVFLVPVNDISQINPNMYEFSHISGTPCFKAIRRDFEPITVSYWDLANNYMTKLMLELYKRQLSFNRPMYNLRYGLGRFTVVLGMNDLVYQFQRCVITAPTVGNATSAPGVQSYDFQIFYKFLQVRSPRPSEPWMLNHVNTDLIGEDPTANVDRRYDFYNGKDNPYEKAADAGGDISTTRGFNF